MAPRFTPHFIPAQRNTIIMTAWIASFLGMHSQRVPLIRRSKSLQPRYSITGPSPLILLFFYLTI